MANYKRHRPRTAPTRNCRSVGHIWKPDWKKYDFLRNWPRWHDIIYHTRPQRRRTGALLVGVMHGRDPDGIAWPVNHRPHVYYW